MASKVVMTRIVLVPTPAPIRVRWLVAVMEFGAVISLRVKPDTKRAMMVTRRKPMAV